MYIRSHGGEIVRIETQHLMIRERWYPSRPCRRKRVERAIVMIGAREEKLIFHRPKDTSSSQN